MTRRAQSPMHGRAGADGGSGLARVGSLRLRHALAAGMLAALTAVAASWGALRLPAGAVGMAALAALTGTLAVAGAIATWCLAARRFDALAGVAQRLRQHGDAASQGGPPLPITDEIDALGDALEHLLAAQAKDQLLRAAADEQIHDSGAMFAALFEHAPFGIALLHADGRFARTNTAYRKIIGYTEEELRGLDEPGLTAPESAAADRQARETLKQNGFCTPYEKEYLARGAIRVPVRIAPFAPAAAGVKGLVWWIAEDLSVRRRLVEALKASETEARMLAAAFAHTASLVVISNADGAIEWVNKAFVDHCGYQLDEIVGRKPGAFLQGPATDAGSVAIIAAAMAAQRGFAVEILNYTRTGRTFWLAMECAPVFDHLGRLERFVAIGRDITAQRQAEQALRESEERHRRIVETAREVIFQFDREGRLTLLNPAWQQLTGHSIADSLGRVFLEFMAPGQQAAGRQAIADILGGRRRIFDELGCFITQSGAARWFEIRAQAFAGPDGTPHCAGTLHDVHERRLAEVAKRDAEEALRESRARYQRAIEGASDIVYELDLRSDSLYLSGNIRSVLAIEPAAIPRHPRDLQALIHPDDRERQRRDVEQLVASTDSMTWETRFKSGDGGYRWLRVRGKTIRDAEGVPIMTSGTLSDVHDARTASEALRDLQARHQRALDGSQDGLWERDLQTGQFYFSDRFDEILGQPPGGLPRETAAWQTLIHPADIGQHREAAASMLGATTAIMWEARLRTASGGYRWLRFRGSAFRGADGRAVLTSGTASDIHDAKLAQLELEAHRDNLTRLVDARTRGLAAATREAEEARAAAEAARQSAVAASHSKSEFLANMSHELRTPMHAIISFAGFGVDKIDRVDHAKLLHYFRNIHKSGSRLLLLLNDLLDLSKFEAGKMEMRRQLTDLRGLINDASAEVEALARSREIVLLVQVSGAQTAWVDSSRMLQVLRNLLSNAIKFSPAGGRVMLRCAWQPAAAGAADAPLLELRVSDEGIGIPDHELEAVFDKFVQSSKTKTGAGGTGLGLAICREIMAAHGGTIHACNNPAPAHGATFVLRFPALADTAVAPRIPSSVS